MKEDFLEVENYDARSFYVSMVVRNRLNNFRWELVVIYDLANHDLSHSFLEELDRKCKRVCLPLVLGGILT